MKKLTSFTKFTTGEGPRIAYTYSEIDEKGNLISQNEKRNFIAVDEKILKAIADVEQYIAENYLEE